MLLYRGCHIYPPKSILKWRKTRQVWSLIGKVQPAPSAASMVNQSNSLRCKSPFLRDGTVPLPPRSSFTEKMWGTVFRLCQKEKKNGRGFLRRKLPSSNINSTSSLSCDQKRSKIESHCLQGCFIYVTGLSGVGSVTVCLWVFKLKNHLWDYFRRTAGLFTDAIHFLSGSSLDLNFALLLFSRYLGTDRFSSSWTRRSKLLK